MLKHTDGLTSLDQELFPGVREELDTRRWLLRKWAFVLMLSVVMVLGSGKLWLTSRKQANDIAEQASSKDAVKILPGEQAADNSWLGEWQITISDAAKTLKAIPKGTVIPVEIESAQFRGLGQVRILARTKAYVFPEKTVMIPPGSEVRGIAKLHGDKWEIHWDSVSVLSVGGSQAEIQAKNEILGKESLNGRSLLVKTN
ncbi:MAG TPA: hypothetical protein VNM47_09000 [Terriglobia bacterium]|nr:hypothetical protein [Terriglobia bacterium]